MKKGEKIRYTVPKLLLQLVLVLLALIILFPVALTFMNSLKSMPDISRSLLAWPDSYHPENFAVVWKRMNFGRSFLNSLFVTIGGVAGLVLVSSTAAYQLQRRRCIASSVIFFAILGSMAVPFQMLMVPMVIVAKTLGLVNSLWGIVIMSWGFLLPGALFLYRGFIKSIPKELEEAALIDGCGQIRAFFRVVFPLLAPINATVIIINTIGIFNEFMLPLVMLSKAELKTLPLSISVFFGSYLNEWQYIMAALTLTILPVLIFFLVMQKKIMSGLAQGALKG